MMWVKPLSRKRLSPTLPLSRSGDGRSSYPLQAQMGLDTFPRFSDSDAARCYSRILMKSVCPSWSSSGAGPGRDIYVSAYWSGQINRMVWFGAQACGGDRMIRLVLVCYRRQGEPPCRYSITFTRR